VVAAGVAACRAAKVDLQPPEALRRVSHFLLRGWEIVIATSIVTEPVLTLIDFSIASGRFVSARHSQGLELLHGRAERLVSRRHRPLCDAPSLWFSSLRSPRAVLLSRSPPRLHARRNFAAFVPFMPLTSIRS